MTDMISKNTKQLLTWKVVLIKMECKEKVTVLHTCHLTSITVCT